MGYRISLLRAGERHPPYSYADISQVVALTDGRHTVDVMVSNTDAAVAPIFRFHSTLVMNFVGSDRTFCGYPRLTV